MDAIQLLQKFLLDLRPLKAKCQAYSLEGNALAIMTINYLIKL